MYHGDADVSQWRRRTTVVPTYHSGADEDRLKCHAGEIEQSGSPGPERHTVYVIIDAKCGFRSMITALSAKFACHSLNCADNESAQ
jgi:hypothetical protein